MVPYFETLILQFLDLFPIEPSRFTYPPRSNVKGRAKTVPLKDRCNSSQIANISIIKRENHHPVRNRSDRVICKVLG